MIKKTVIFTLVCIHIIINIYIVIRESVIIIIIIIMITEKKTLLNDGTGSDTVQSVMLQVIKLYIIKINKGR